MQDKYRAYSELLIKWGGVFNLTAARTVEQIMTEHVQDSLSLLPFLTNVTSVLDVGTGAGLPGIPLSIAREDVQFKLLDSRQKKINFVQHVVTSLQLPNVQPICSRVETLSLSDRVDMVVSRAFASLYDFTSVIDGLCDDNTQIIAMKGRVEQAKVEAEQLPRGFKLLNIEKVVVPGVAKERCLVFLAKQEDIYK